MEDVVYTDLGAIIRSVVKAQAPSLITKLAASAHFTHASLSDPVPPDVYLVPMYDNKILHDIRKLCSKYRESIPDADLLVVQLVRCGLHKHTTEDTLDTYLSWRVKVGPRANLDYLLRSFSIVSSLYLPKKELLLIAWTRVTTGSWSVAEFLEIAKLMIKCFYTFPAALLVEDTFIKLVDQDGYLSIMREFADAGIDAHTMERLSTLAILNWQISPKDLMQNGYPMGEITLCTVMQNHDIDRGLLISVTDTVVKNLRQKKGNIRGDPQVLSHETWTAILERRDHGLCKWLYQRHRQEPDIDMISKVTNGAFKNELMRVYGFVLKR